MPDAPAPVRPSKDDLDIAAVLAAVGQARVRLWANASWRRAIRAAPWAFAIAAAWVVATRMAWLDARFDVAGDALVLLTAIAGIAFAVAHRVPARKAARTLDQAGATHDALATALWLRQADRGDGWAVAQARAANRVAQGLQVADLVPLRLWPTGASLALGLAGVWIAACVAPLGASPWSNPTPRVLVAVAPELPSAPGGFISARDVLGEDVTSLLGADAALLREVEQQVPDAATRDWLRDLRNVIEGVADGSLDKREALERLAELDARKPRDAENAGGNDPSPARDVATDPGAAAEAERQRDLAARQAVLDAADKAMIEAPKGPDKEDLKQAIENGDLGLVAKLMEKLANKDLTADDVKKWQKTLEKFADALKDRKVPKELEALAKKVERLQQQRSEQGGLAPAEQRRLQEARHQLEQLRKQIGDVQGADHQLQRLEREARNAADELRRQQQDQQAQKAGKREDASAQAQRAQQALRQAADELRRQDEGHKSRQAQRVGQSRLRDARDALGRSGQRPGQSGDQGQRQQSQGGQADQPQRGRDSKAGDDDAPCEGNNPGQQGKQQQSADGKQPGKGKRDQQGHNSGDNGGKLDGNATGNDAQGTQKRSTERGDAQRPGFRLGSKGLGDKTRTELINEGYEQRASKGGSQGGSGTQEGPGQGNGKGGPDQGKDPKLAGTRTEKLKGEHSEGPDTKRVFLDAARKGFARQGWRQAYREYSEVAEEMVDKESLPAGRKALVRRYFEKIRPR